MFDKFLKFKLKFFVLLFVGILSGAGFISCSKLSPQTSPSSRPTPDSRPVSTKPESPPVAEKHAADELVKEGIIKLEASDYKQASWYFEEAIRLEPNYGVPYYWLSQTNLKAGDSSKASLFLDKADQLLGQDPEWRDKLDDLRSKIGGAGKF